MLKQLRNANRRACTPFAHPVHRRAIIAQASASSDGSNSSNADNNSKGAEAKPLGVFGKIKKFVVGDGMDKARLAELGVGAFAAYGVISNLNFGTIAVIAWVALVKQTGNTPLMEGMWPQFLALYAGMWIASNFMRPIRLTLALAAAPAFNHVINQISQTTGLNKGFAFGIMLFMIATGTMSMLVMALAVFGGFPGGRIW